MLALAGAAYACACCADPGLWSQTRARLTAAERAELDRIRWGGTAHTYVTQRGLDGVRGIAPPSASYSVSTARSGRRLELVFRDAKRRSGALSFLLPRTAVLFSVDPGAGRRSSGGGPLLYKEWRFEGPVTGTGVFASGMAGRPRFHLILHGRGNRCVAAADFRRFTLQVSGPRARYSLYGSLARPDPA